MWVDLIHPATEGRRSDAKIDVAITRCVNVWISYGVDMLRRKTLATILNVAFQGTLT